MPPAQKRPLTAFERGRLLAGCVPFLFLLAGTIFVLTIWSDVTEALTGQRTPLIFGAVMGVILLITGWIAVKRVRDVLAGSALVEEDRLKRLWRPRHGAMGNGCYGNFERLGTLRMSRSEFGRAGTGFDRVQLARSGRETARAGPVPYRLTYSPASKIAWSVEQA
jgi:hypothetical protein